MSQFIICIFLALISVTASALLCKWCNIGDDGVKEVCIHVVMAFIIGVITSIIGVL